MHLPPRWVIAVSLGVAAAILGDSLLYAVLPTQWPNLGIDVGMVGVLLSANRLVRLVSNSVSGWVVSRWGVRRPFMISVFVAAGTTLAYASGLGFGVLLFARSVWGVCWSFLRLGGYMAALEASREGNVGYYLGFFNGVMRFGSFMATLIGGLLTDLIGFQSTVVLFTSATILGGLGVVRERPTGHKSDLAPAKKEPLQNSQKVNVDAEAVPEKVNSPTRLRLWTVYVSVFFHSMIISGLLTATLGLWLLTTYGTSTQVFFLTLGVATISGFLLSSRFLSDFCWGPISGHLSDRFGRHIIAPSSALLETGSLLLLSSAGVLSWTAISAVVLFLSATAFQVSLDATAGDMAPITNRARTMSWYATWSDLGSALGPLIGYLIGAGIGLEWMYRGAAVLISVLAVVYVGTFRRSAGRREKEYSLRS